MTEFLAFAERHPFLVTVWFAMAAWSVSWVGAGIGRLARWGDK